jgi:propionate CoA-transferase
VDGRLSGFGRGAHVVVNYDNFNLGPAARDTFFAMVKHNEDNYLLSSTRYSTDASFRQQLGRPSPRPTSSSASTATSTRRARACG